MLKCPFEGAKGKSPPVLKTNLNTPFDVYLGYKNNLEEVLVFWENNQVDYEKSHKKVNEVRIPIPDGSIKLEHSILRIIAWGEGGISNMMEVALKNGKIVEKSSEK